MAASKAKITIWIAIIGALGVIGSTVLPRWLASDKKEPATETVNFSGAVVEEGSNSSVVQAEITIVGRNEHYYSEGNGNFRIQVKTDHDIRIRVNKAGYTPYERSYALPDENVIIVLQKQK